MTEYLNVVTTLRKKEGAQYRKGDLIEVQATYVPGEGACIQHFKEVAGLSPHEREGWLNRRYIYELVITREGAPVPDHPQLQEIIAEENSFTLVWVLDTAGYPAGEYNATVHVWENIKSFTEEPKPPGPAWEEPPPAPRPPAAVTARSALSAPAAAEIPAPPGETGPVETGAEGEATTLASAPPSRPAAPRRAKTAPAPGGKKRRPREEPRQVPGVSVKKAEELPAK